MRRILFRFAAGRFLASIADQILLYAVPLMVYERTGKVSYSGFVFLMEWLPRVISLPFAGVFVDKVGGRRVYAMADLTRGLSCLAALLLFTLPGVATAAQVGALAALVALCGFFFAQCFIAMESTLPKFTSGRDLAKVQSLLQGIDQISMIVGPGCAAGLSTLVGKPALFWFAGVLFLASFLNILHLKQLDGTTATHAGKSMRSLFDVVSDLRTGWAVMQSETVLFGFCMLMFAGNLLVGLTLSTAAPLTTGRFQMPEQCFAILNTVAGSLAVVCFFAVPKVVARFSIQSLGVVSLFCILAGALVMSSSASFAVFAAGFCLLFGTTGVFNIYVRTERVKLIPAEHLGKTLGLMVLLSQLSMPLSGFVVAGATDAWPVQRIMFFTVCLVALVNVPLLLAIQRRNIVTLSESSRL